ncbi:MAG: glycosyltransferase family 4 protein [Anaerolineaceae bacterium]|nr:glycosyltransferase family 4 protein [Anaerolineaceae bacterium]
MRILIVLTYYRPHTSGLTIYAERLAKAFARRGHQVTVMTSQFDKNTALEEVVDGVRIVRVPVWFRISKGVIMPKFGMIANRLVAQHDVIQLHLPQFDAAGLSIRGRLLRKPTVTTYHCDLNMPVGILSKVANFAIDRVNDITSLFTHRFIAYTRDFAEHSPYLSRNLKKVHVIPPPVVLPESDPKAVNAFTARYNPEECYPVIGMATRFASEKGVEVLLNALPKIQSVYPNFKVLYAGTYIDVMGEKKYFDRLIPTIREYEAAGQWEFLGNLTPQEMTAYYPNLDMLVVPSLNSTESFGLVQIEAFLNGTPTIASALPGVRQPVIQHEMGKVIPIGDSNALAEAAIQIAGRKADFIRDPEPIRKRYDPDFVASEYEKVFAEIAEELKKN